MANLFQEVLTSSNDSLIGPTYSYYNNINSLDEISMSDEGTNRQTSKDINSLIKYMESLVNGKNRVDRNDTSLGFLTSFLYDSNPPYQSITMQTLADDNVNSSESHYVTLVDKEPTNDDVFEDDVIMMPRDPIAQLYFASLGVLGLFILYRLMEKSR